MNVLRDILHIFSYPYLVVRRITGLTWSLFWTRGLVNVLPFVQRRSIEDSSTSSKTANRVKFDTSSTQPANVSSEVVEVSLKEELESVVVSSDGKESSDTSSNPSACLSCQSSSASSSASVMIEKEVDTSTSGTDTLREEKNEAVTSSGLESSEINIPKPETSGLQTGEGTPENHSGSPSPARHEKQNSSSLRAKRNSTTVEEEETVLQFISLENEKALRMERQLDEVLLNHISKKPKLESPQPSRSRGASESDTVMTKLAKIQKATTSKEKTKRHRQTSDQRPELTHFIGVQMTNPTIYSRLEEIQQKMMEKELFHTSVRKLQKGSFFAETLISVKKSHITLHVFRIEDDEQMEAAKTAIQKVWKKYQEEFEPEPVTLRVEGVGHFKNSVLFAKIQGEKELDKLHRITESLREEFRLLKIYGDDTKPFKPHLTLAKLSKVKWNKDFKKHNVRTFPRDLWHDYESTLFGHQAVESLQFLEMRSNQETGYYEIVEIYPFTTIMDKVNGANGNGSDGVKMKDSKPDELDTNDNKN